MEDHDNRSPVMQATIILRTLMTFESRRLKKRNREERFGCARACDDSYVSPVQRLLHAPSVLAYAEQHRWVYGGGGCCQLGDRAPLGR